MIFEAESLYISEQTWVGCCDERSNFMLLIIFLKRKQLKGCQLVYKRVCLQKNESLVQH